MRVVAFVILLLTMASPAVAQSRSEFWVVTDDNASELSAINAGYAFMPEGADYVLALASTTYHQGTAETRWTTPASVQESIAFRCDAQTFLVRGSTL